MITNQKYSQKFTFFLKEWEIGEKFQHLIVKTIRNKENPEEIVNIYNYLVENYVNVDTIEDVVFYPSFKEYSIPLLKNSKTRKENLCKIFTKGRINSTKEEMILIIGEMYKEIGSDILKILFPCIDLKDCSIENLKCLFNISSYKTSNNDSSISESDDSSEMKNPKKSFMNNQSVSDDWNNDLIGQLASIIRQIMITNKNVTEEKEKLKQMFIETKINEHSTDSELFLFHKNYLKNRYLYLNHFDAGNNNHDENKVKKTKEKFQYSKEMIERGMKLQIPEVFLKLIKEEEEEKNIIQKCKSFLQSKDITLLSLFDMSLSLYGKKNKRKFEIIVDFTLQKVSSKEIFFLLKMLVDNKVYKSQKINKKLIKEAQIKKIIQECEKNQTKIKSIKIPKSVVNIPNSTFSLCASLKDVEIEDGIIEISYNTFYKCTSLKKIKIPKSVEIIGNGAFIECSALAEIEIEEGVATIGKNAFLGCSMLKKIKIPKSVKLIGKAAFSGCSSLKTVEIEDGIIKIDKGEITEFKSLGKYNLSDISKWLPLKEIKIDEGTVEIPSYEFYGFISLERIKIPKSVLKIGEFAFTGNTSLVDIEINEGVETIGQCAFFSCRSLKNITIPKSINTIGASAFYSCEVLKDVDIKEGVKSIEKEAFSKCISLNKIKIPKSVINICENVFSECTSLTNAEINEGVFSIGEKAFFKCSKLEKITIPKSIDTIGQKAFGSCESLKEVEISEGVTSIGEKAFFKCTKLEKITIPKSIDLIGKKAFGFCESLKEVEINEGVTCIDEEVFSQCLSLIKIKIPKSVLKISDNSFFKCTSLTDVEINEGVTSIGKDAFGYCSSLKKIKMPKSLRTISKGTFAFCHSLTELYFPNDSNIEIDDTAFIGIMKPKITFY